MNPKQIRKFEKAFFKKIEKLNGDEDPLQVAREIVREAIGEDPFEGAKKFWATENQRAWAFIEGCRKEITPRAHTFLISFVTGESDITWLDGQRASNSDGWWGIFIDCGQILSALDSWIAGRIEGPRSVALPSELSGKLSHCTFEEFETLKLYQQIAEEETAQR